MKIVHLNTFDVQGGAARAAYRLHKGLLQIGQDSVMLSRYRVSGDRTVKQVCAVSPAQDYRDTSFASIQHQYIDSNRTALSNTLFSLPYPGFDLSQLEQVITADVINLHWVALFQSPMTLAKLFALGKPIVWTLHDMWAFTGGCHYSAGCDGYQHDCMNCPQLANNPFQLAAAILKDKINAFATANLTIVTPSRWLANCARTSKLFADQRVEVIPYSLETDVFTPLEKAKAKRRIGISPETVTLLFGAASADESRKGLTELVEAVHYCLEDPKFQQLVLGNQLEILCFGYAGDRLQSLPVPVRSLGYIDSDHELSALYAAADVFVLPSLEDNLPNTLLESLSCATPVIAFEVGGIPDLIQPGVTGRLVPVRDTHQLAEALLDCVFNLSHYEQMGQNGRAVMADGYAITVQAERYLRLYQALLAEK
jgi:glycosyltransferase involved in cell wall biosynthesis